MKKKILVIEDDEDLVRVIEMKLRQEGYEVDHAYDGETALKKISEFKPDLLILDVMIPKIDGVSLNNKLKEDPKTRDLPIIVLTGKIGLKELFMVKDQLTVSAYYQKPILLSTLVDKIKELLKEK